MPMKRRDVIVALVLLGVGVVAAGGGAWWWYWELSQVVERIGGAIVDEPETPIGPVVSVVFTARPVGDRDLHALRGQHGFDRLFLDSTRVTGDCLADLKSAKDLRWLSICGSPVTDDGLAHLPTLPNLELLNLGKTQVTDAGLEHLRKQTNLRQLFLYNTDVTDAGLEHLRGLDHLEELDLTRTAVTREGVRRLQEALPGLKQVHTGPPPI
jgi:hypothetical protein